MIDMYKDNNISDSGCLSSLRGQFNSKYKKNQKNNSNNKNKSDLETNYKTFYTSDSPKKDKIPINIKKRKDYIINDYKNKGNRALSTSNIIKYNNNINNERNNINNYNKNKKK
jgi:hypothetical protein